MSADATPLFQPFRLGDLELPNRIVMAPLTRNRATHGNDAPNALNAEYYRQRAGAGLIVSEATQISPQGQGYIWTPGVYSDAQVEGWRGVTTAVHAAGGRIFNQIWHVGRISHTSLQPDNGAPVSSSAVPANTKTFVESGFVPVSEPRALEPAEIPGLVADYATATGNARKAGFDGVEIHAANGYLLAQFLQDGVNRRTDAYGGSAENRARLVLEVVEAVVKAWDAKRVGIRISPVSPANDISDSDPARTFGYLAEKLSAFGLAYLHVVEGATGGPRDVAPFDFGALKKAFKGPYMANNGYTRELAVDAVGDGRADLVAFGRPFIANPDLVQRLASGAPLATPDQKTFYGGDGHGYTDYPTIEKAAA